MLNTKFAPYNIHYAREITVRNNIFALGRLNQLDRYRWESHKSIYFENNIIYWTQGVLFSGNWRDEIHQFYFHPRDKSGTREDRKTFDMDFNLYFNPLKTIDDIDFGNGKKWKEWQAMGKDIHSIYADPLFEDVENFNFRLKKDSPAFRLGFIEIDINQAGLAGAKVGPLTK